MSLLKLTENLEWFLELYKMQCNCVSSALLITTMQFAKFLRPGLSCRVTCSDLFIGKWVFDDRGVEVFLSILVQLEQFTCTVAQKLMQSHDNCQSI